MTVAGMASGCVWRIFTLSPPGFPSSRKWVVNLFKTKKETQLSFVPDFIVSVTEEISCYLIPCISHLGLPIRQSLIAEDSVFLTNSLCLRDSATSICDDVLSGVKFDLFIYFDRNSILWSLTRTSVCGWQLKLTLNFQQSCCSPV